MFCGLSLSLYTRYELALGTTPGGTQLMAYSEYPQDTRRVWFTIDLSSVPQVFVTMRGYNAAGLYSTVTSDGVYISRASAGLESLKPSHVYDGLNPFQDL